ncbi:MAG: GGDEF domain-containing phosphodiesterase [Lachnospiraceae bacterium]|nr:GGDEF domain-containing phosphodiesterase [Lachnospiraceae bacterium]
MFVTQYNYFFDIAALCVALVIIIEFHIKRTLPSRQTHAYLEIHSFTTLAAVFDLSSTIALGYAMVLPGWLNELLLVLFYVFYHGIGACYLYYVILATKRTDEPLKPYERALIIVPYAIDFVMAVTNPLFGLMGKFDAATGTYSSAGCIGYYYAYAQTLFYLIMGLVYFVVRRQTMLKKHRFIVLFYSIVALAAMILQVMHPTILLGCFGTELGSLMIAFTMENPTYYENQMLGIYNRFAFDTIVEKKVSDAKQFSVIGARIEGLLDIRGVIGMGSVSQLLKSISQFFQSVVDRNCVFYVSEAQFAFIVYGGESEVEMYMKKIQNRFEEPFEDDGEGVKLSVVLSHFSYPRDVKSTEGIIDLLEYSLANGGDNGSIAVIADSKLLEERKRGNQVLQRIRTALAERGFMIYFQPIYSVEQDAFTSAEVLLRLHDDELGFISPAEFVPIAEKNGLIVKMGEYVLRETCRFLAESRIWNKGIEYVNINLSTVQCMQANLADQIIRILDEYHLDYCRISLEIEESLSLMQSRTFKDNMVALMNKGVRFSLDNYGTGYSNLSTLVDYPFSIVKLDKAMLWSAMKNDKAMMVLRQTIRMMKQFSLELICEGVETEEQAQLLAYYGCDFFQGFLYAKPQPAESLIKLLENKDKLPKVF